MNAIERPLIALLLCLGSAAVATDADPYRDDPELAALARQLADPDPAVRVAAAEAAARDDAQRPRLRRLLLACDQPERVLRVDGSVVAGERVGWSVTWTARGLGFWSHYALPPLASRELPVAAPVVMYWDLYGTRTPGGRMRSQPKPKENPLQRWRLHPRGTATTDHGQSAATTRPGEVRLFWHARSASRQEYAINPDDVVELATPAFSDHETSVVVRPAAAAPPFTVDAGLIPQRIHPPDSIMGFDAFTRPPAESFTDLVPSEGEAPQPALTVIISTNGTTTASLVNVGGACWVPTPLADRFWWLVISASGRVLSARSQEPVALSASVPACMTRLDQRTRIDTEISFLRDLPPGRHTAWVGYGPVTADPVMQRESHIRLWTGELVCGPLTVDIPEPPAPTP